MQNVELYMQKFLFILSFFQILYVISGQKLCFKRGNGDIGLRDNYNSGNCRVAE